MKIILSIILSQANAVFYCPKMECLEAGTKDSSMDSTYTCYKWTSGPYIGPNLDFKVRKCPNEDMTCDIFGRNDKLRINYAQSKTGQFKENVMATFEAQIEGQSFNFNGIKTDAWCTYDESLWKDLHIGTQCLFSWQC